MSFEKKLKREIDKIEVPSELRPENIAAMLKAEAPYIQRERIALNTNTAKAPIVRRSVIMRTIAAAAACVALAAGCVGYLEITNTPAVLDSEIEYKDVRQPQSYDDLFDIYTQICLNSDNTETDMDMSADGFSQAETVKAENGAVYYLSGGSIYSLTAEGIERIADVSDKNPIEMYIENDSLILISEESEETVFSSGNTENEAAYSINASEVPADDAYTLTGENAPSAFADSTDSAELTSETVRRTGVIADIYSISEGKAEYSGSYRQSGEYVSSRISDGTLCMVTSYCGYRTKPLGEETDLDNYVPYYELDGQRRYVAAEDITVPANANSTDYTVVSAVDTDLENASVKALLGSSKKVYSTGDMLYIAGVGSSEEKNTPYTVITSFYINNGIRYVANGSVEGTLLSSGNMSEYGGNLRVATANTTAEGSVCTDIYVLDRNMSVINSAGSLLPGVPVSSISFTGRYTAVYSAYSSLTLPELIIDLGSAPPVVAEDMMNEKTSSLSEYTAGKVLSFGSETAEDGTVSLVLSMYGENGVKLSEITAAEGDNVASTALINRRSLLINPEKNVIGVPVTSSDEFGIHSRYYLFSYNDETGFSQVGSVEYSDPDESGSFRRAIVSGDNIYIISDARIVLARLYDMVVIESFDF